ncbi:MAG: glycosyltransferase family 4 protein, partial [Geminicoccaceae bacterium]
MRSSPHFIVPGPLEQRTGGYIYDRRIVEGLRASGWTALVHELAGAFPKVDEAARRAALHALEAMPRSAVPVIDGLALPAFAELADRLPQPWVALVHHPLALETGLTPAEAGDFAELERRLLAGAARVIVTGAATRHDLADYGLEDRRIGVVHPGTDPAPLARGSTGPGLELLCVASLTPRKGHLILLEALAELSALDWHLVCVGSAERDPACALEIARALDRFGLRERIELVGERGEAELGPYYDRADLFVLASYHEGYGMALAEALARGLPVVSTTAGAIPETVPDGAGLLVAPGNPPALAAALRRVMIEPE